MANAVRLTLAHDVGPVSSNLIVSYDGTPNDDDALALGKLLARTGASLALAYIRHSREFDPRREELAQHDAERRLEQGAAWLEDPDIPRHVVFSGSTGEGLEQLADAEHASVIVFGSDYRTPPGRAEPGTTAQRLLEGGSVAIAVAAAGLRTQSDSGIETIAVAGPGADTTARDTAEALAGKLGAEIVDLGPPVDLIVVGSQPGASSRRITLSGSTRTLLNTARGSVLVLPSGAAIDF
ncbi:MAG TPA: universal stress protein [Solirubrobacteraceae bacterium]|nr:universal stress protein [Solirubrobacteraceae bacterium]